MSEHTEQAAVIKWARDAEIIWPELALLHAIPNGGKREKKVAARLKAEGVKPGVPDMCLPVARGGYHSLWIELKTERGRLTAEQNWWLGALEAHGNKALMCRGAAATIRTIEEYLRGVA
ncbi:MAG: VRR-NUC domain-containing protein [Chloroflexi bacterium]|nr:VRR-NUC domain-containing protein [Chloroflexota bacterium]